MTNKLNRRSFIGYMSTALATSFFLKACADSPSTITENPDNNSTDSSSSSETFKIAIALPGVITDGGWNQSGYEGIKKAAEKLNGEMGKWTPTSWWEGKIDGGYITCGTCIGSSDYIFDEQNQLNCTNYNG